MARTLKDWGPTALAATTDTTIVDGSTTLKTVVLMMTVINTGTSTITLRISKATSTTTSAATAIGGYDMPIPPNSTVIIRGPIIIEEAGTAVNINMRASAANLTVSASGYTE